MANSGRGKRMNGGGLVRAPMRPAAVAPAAAGDGADAAAGAAGAFRRLVEAHGPRAFRVAYRLLHDSGEAEDVVQDAFTRLWVNLATLDLATGAGGWLHRVIVNLCLDRLRRRQFSADGPEPGSPPEVADERPGADVHHDRARLAAVTSAAIARLPDRQRAAVMLTYYEALPNAAAAAALDLNIKAFESLLLRARTALRGLLADAGIVPGSLS